MFAWFSFTQMMQYTLHPTIAPVRLAFSSQTKAILCTLCTPLWYCFSSCLNKYRFRIKRFSQPMTSLQIGSVLPSGFFCFGFFLVFFPVGKTRLGPQQAFVIHCNVLVVVQQALADEKSVDCHFSLALL